MISEEAWTAHINIGLGPIKFGMSREDVAKFDGIFGELDRIIDFGEQEEQTDDELQDFINRLGLAGEFNESEISEIVAIQNEQVAKDKNIVDERRTNPFALALEYNRNSLFAITTDQHTDILSIDGIYVFRASPKDLCIYLQHTNGTALASEDNVLFDKLGILLSGFYFQNEAGSWRFYNSEKDANELRYFTIFASSEIERYLTDEYVSVDFTNK